MLAQKDIVLFVIFLALIRVGAYLVTPYFPIYLNNFLHIQRGTVSTIITLQTFAMLIGYTFAPWLEKKLGSIVSISVMTLSCTPLMLLMAKGNIFGSNVAIAIGIVFVPPFRLGQRFNAGPTVIANGACPEKLTARI